MLSRVGRDIILQDTRNTRYGCFETSQTSNEKRKGRFWHEKRPIINRVMMKKMFFFYVPSIEFFLDSSSILIYESNKFFSRSINVGTRMYNLPFCYETCIRLISNWRARKHCDSTVRLNSAEFRTVLHGKIIIRFTRAVNPINSVHFSIELTR